MRRDEYQELDAIGLAEHIARGEVSAAEVLEVALEAIAEINPTLKAVNVVLEREARETLAAGLPEGPLAGVPFLLKDISALMAGVPTSAGSGLFKEPAPVDSAVVAAYRRAGLVICGKSNTPELALVGITEPRAFGRTLNPWDPSRISGGSSGGAAAAVAARLTPIAHGTDGGGSIRIPSACCGVFGFKPSRGRVSTAPLAEGWAGIAVTHAITRSVRDSALLLDIEANAVLDDPFGLGPPATPFLRQIGTPPGRLRIGVVRSNLMSVPLATEVADAVASAAILVAELGHQVEELTPDTLFDSYPEVIFPIAAVSVAATLRFEGERRGFAVAEDEVEPLTWALNLQGLQMASTDYAVALQRMSALARAFHQVFSPFDVVLLPTLAQLPPPVGVLTTATQDIGGLSSALFAFAPNTQPFNMTGQPAMSVPLSWTDGGIPVGVQFAGRHAQEGVLLALAAQLEAARPWAQRRPPPAPSS